MLTREATQETLMHWQKLWEAGHSQMQPNRKTGTALIEWLCEHYCVKEVYEPELLEIVSLTVTENEYFAEKLPPDTLPSPRCFFILHEGAGETLYSQQKGIWQDCDPIFVGIDEVTGEFHVEGSPRLWNELFLLRGLDAQDLGNFVMTGQYLELLDRKGALIIDRAGVEDIPAINKLLRQVLMVHHNGRPDLFKANCKKYTDSELMALLQDDSRPVFGAFDENGELLGYAFCIHQQHENNNVLTDIKTLYIDDLCVEENARGRHIGTALYKHVLRYAKECGCYNVTLNVWECNAGAKKFYEALGMQVQKTGMETIL